MSLQARDLIKKLALLGMVMLFASLLAELAVRILFPGWAPRTGRLVELWQYDSDYGWSHVPGSSGRFASFGFDTLVEINSRGFRGPEPPPQKDPTKRRIVVVGDSFTWGFGVEYDEIFASRIQAACRDVEVINLGVSGYSTDQELLLFKEQGADYEPDVVILLVAANDAAGNTRSKEYVYYYKPIFVIDGEELILKNRPVPRANLIVRIAASVSKRSYVLTQLNRAVHGSHGTQPDVRPAPSAPGAGVEPPRTAAERLTARLLDRFVSAVEAVGATPVVVFVDGMGGSDRRLAYSLEQSGTELVHVDDHMPFGNYDTYHLPGDFHWNPAGHALVGDAVIDALVSSGAISGEACSRP